MTRRRRYSPEVKERAVGMVIDQQAQQESQWSAISSIASKIDCTRETVSSIYSSARPELDRSPVCRNHACMISSFVRARPLARPQIQDTKLLIYDLFQKGRVLAQDGMVCRFQSSIRILLAPRQP